MKTVLYQQSHCLVSYIQALNCVQLEWEGFATSEKFREACNVSLDALVKYKANKMIADNARAKIVSVEDQKWMNEVWFPKAIAAGFRFSAVVVAKDVFRDMAIKKIVNELDSSQFTAQFFDTSADAQAWIAEIEAAK